MPLQDQINADSVVNLMMEHELSSAMVFVETLKNVQKLNKVYLMALLLSNNQLKSLGNNL
jgi:CRISPR/Cas system-associated endonuclease Cas3-HD